MTGRPGCRTMEMIGGSSASYLARTPCVSLFSTLFTRLETEGLLDYQGRAGDHFHCTVEPSPGHIRCRKVPCEISLWKKKGKNAPTSFCRSAGTTVMARYKKHSCWASKPQDKEGVQGQWLQQLPCHMLASTYSVPLERGRPCRG